MRIKTRGASLLSYGLIVGLISVVALGAVTGSGSSVNQLFGDVSDSLEGANGGGATPEPVATPTPTPTPFVATSCANQLAVEPTSTDGTYTIDPDGEGTGLDSFDVFCDMTTDSGGWTLLALNDQTTTFTNFNKSWAEYKAGFGSVDTGALGWIGNERIHVMTQGGVTLHVRHTPGGGYPIHEYGDFTVGNEASDYSMSLTNLPTSYDNDRMAGYHSLYPFSTHDNDNDVWSNNCADHFAAGWWYGACYYQTIAGNNTGQVYWRGASDEVLHVTEISMWIR